MTLEEQLKADAAAMPPFKPYAHFHNGDLEIWWEDVSSYSEAIPGTPSTRAWDSKGPDRDIERFADELRVADSGASRVTGS